MAAHKPLTPFAGAALIDAVIARVERQVERLALDVPAEMADAYRARFPHTVLADLFPERAGPLCGIVTGLEWLGGDVLATFPCDTPFLPLDLVAQLARHPAPVVVGEMPVCGLWSKGNLAALKAQVGGSVRGAVEALGGRACDIAGAARHAFFNVNAPRDLEEAMLLHAQADEASRRR